jgi:hypothetical protein
MTKSACTESMAVSPCPMDARNRPERQSAAGADVPVDAYGSPVPMGTLHRMNEISNSFR